MSRFNRTATASTPRQSRGSTPLRSTDTTTLTHEGGAAFVQDARTELYRLSLAGFIAEDSFYESGEDKMARARRLIDQIVAEDETDNKADSGQWLASFIRWMRTDGNMRTAPILTAVEAVRARLAAGGHSFNREIISGALDRADEPGELIAYALRGLGPRGGKTLPKPIKRGVSDALPRLYNEFSTLRYDTPSHALRFGDVVELVQPRTNGRGEQNDDLLRHLIDRRHAYNANEVPESLAMIRTRAELEAVPVEQRRALVEEAAAAPAGEVALRLRASGLTWEWLASWLQGPMDATAWKVALPTIGYMAALRNLRNLDRNGIDDVTAQILADRLADPAQVAKSRQFPFRFLSAYEAVESDRWRVALGRALDAAVQNIPKLSGRTLILTDTSHSMDSRMSEKSTVTAAKAAALFAVATAHRCGPQNATLVEFATTSGVHQVKQGASVLRQVAEITSRQGRYGMGTEMVEAVRKHYAGHDRVILFTDMQAFGSRYGSPADQVPAHVPFYAFDLGGYAESIVPDAPNRHQLAGLTDATFRWIPLVEAGETAGWPWER